MRASTGSPYASSKDMRASTGSPFASSKDVRTSSAVSSDALEPGSYDDGNRNENDGEELAVCTPHEPSVNENRDFDRERSCIASSMPRRMTRVLVVDDVAMNRKVMLKLLRERSEECVEAVDGVDAVAKVRTSIEAGEKPYDMITMDYQMPNMDGPTATKIIREMGYTGVVVGVTGNVLPDDMRHFMEHGVDAVLGKPMDVSAFDDLVACRVVDCSF